MFSRASSYRSLVSPQTVGSSWPSVFIDINLSPIPAETCLRHRCSRKHALQNRRAEPRELRSLFFLNSPGNPQSSSEIESSLPQDSRVLQWDRNAVELGYHARRIVCRRTCRRYLCAIG